MYMYITTTGSGSGSGTVQHPYKGPTGQGGVRMQCKFLMLKLVSVVGIDFKLLFFNVVLNILLKKHISYEITYQLDA